MKSIEHIVLIDDNRTTHYISEHLIKCFDPNIKTTCFSNGGSALAYFNSLSEYSNPQFRSIPNLVILDLSMPDMNGWEVLEEFERLRLFHMQSIDVIILSNSDYDEDIKRSEVNPFCKGYIVKPLTLEKLSNAITILRNGFIAG